MKVIRVGVTGGRDYGDSAKVCHVLNRAHSVLKGRMFLVVGDARGLDTHARLWAIATLALDKHQLFKADWDQYGPAAGPIRNKAMIDSGLNLLIAFPGGKGTANMKQQCRERGIKILEIE